MHRRTYAPKRTQPNLKETSSNTAQIQCIESALDWRKRSKRCDAATQHNCWTACSELHSRDGQPHHGTMLRPPILVDNNQNRKHRLSYTPQRVVNRKKTPVNIAKYKYNTCIQEAFTIELSPIKSLMLARAIHMNQKFHGSETYSLFKPEAHNQRRNAQVLAHHTHSREQPQKQRRTCHSQSNNRITYTGPHLAGNLRCSSLCISPLVGKLSIYP